MDTVTAYHISITGVVQGVGFRPFVYNLATRLDLHGWVLNHSGGVEIEVEGPQRALQAFIVALRSEAPPLARVESLTVRPIPPNGTTDFEIRHSEREEGRYQLISPDVATCADCLSELLDPTNRRYRYPFINCTNCGPRFTIIADIPYDRPNTTMRVFPLCADCRTEYEDPADRRFHAQPNACPACGPHVWLTDAAGASLVGDGRRADSEAVLAKARELLLAGNILALKGLGGFHLACDATDARAVRALRSRKRRPHKPFAVMVATLDGVKAHCEVPPAAERLLSSPQCPIVLLERRPCSSIVDEVAPNSHVLGMMVPYTPLHHILLRDVGRPLVMTSGNLTEEPIAMDNDEALRRLAPLADAFLLHNRGIYARYDDSVWHIAPVAQGLPQPLRRARSYAPFPIRLPFKTQQIFASGPLLKATFCLTRDEYAFVSQHIGDMENLETLEHYEAALATYKHLFRLEPESVVCDMHPDYLTTRFAQQMARQIGMPAPYRVQHHHAHIAACLADNGRAPDAGPVIGVSFDGTGYGEDGAIWGGEWLVGDYRGFRRMAHLEYLPLPGGDAAIREPWRIAVAYVCALLGAEGIPAGAFPPDGSRIVCQQVEHRVNTPPTSSMGRLFDAVSALLGVRHEATYEAQAAIELEQVAARVGPEKALPYPFDVEADDAGLIVRLQGLFEALMDEIERGTTVSEISLRFHATVAQMVMQVCDRIRAETGLKTVALSGGVFQNRLLLRLTVPLLEEAGFEVYLHRQVPCNDGGVSLGQAMLAQFGDPPLYPLRGGMVAGW
jgi:hydrogenase maturation protein HypF